jgi:hypothetical protein
MIILERISLYILFFNCLNKKMGNRLRIRVHEGMVFFGRHAQRFLKHSTVDDRKTTQ